MAKQTKSARIRTMLEQGKAVKEICKAVKCNPALVYQVKSYDKAKAHKVTAKKLEKKAAVMKAAGYEKVTDVWVKGASSTSSKPLIQPKDYAEPKRNIVQRFFNWLCGG